jgi:hypothetical protein
MGDMIDTNDLGTFVESYDPGIAQDAKDESVVEKTLDKSVFPTEAFEFDDPNADDTPSLNLKSPWGFSIGGGTVIRKVTISTSSPSGGDDGDVWFVREA